MSEAAVDDRCGRGLGILLLSRDLDLVRALATRVVVLDAGRAVGDVLPASPELPATGTSTGGHPLLEAMNLSASLRPPGSATRTLRPC